MKKKFIIKESHLVSFVKSKLNEDTNEKHYCKKSFNRFFERQFCSEMENFILNDKKNFFNVFEIMKKKYFESDEIENLNDVVIEKLTQESEIVKEGIKELWGIYSKVGENCKKITFVWQEEIENLINNNNIYFRLPNNEYSLLNRLSTNYSAIAVIITEYFSQLGLLEGPINVKYYSDPSFWKKLVNTWMRHMFKPDSEFIDIRTEPKSLEITPNWDDLFDLIFKQKATFDYEGARQKISDVISSTRQRGFDTENEFEEVLKKDIEEGRVEEYIRYAKDFGFVDMFTGIDFLVKMKGERQWTPVQVKSSRSAQSLKIDTLGCRRYKIVEKTKDGFKNW